MLKTFPSLTSIKIAAFTALVGFAAASSAHAQLTTYNSLASFQAAVPVTTLENLEAGTPVIGVGLTAPLDASTNNAGFTPGQIAPGVRFNTEGSSPNEFYYNQNEFGPTKVLTTNHGPNSANIILFNNDATAVGFDLFDGGASYTVTVFNLTGVQIDSPVIVQGSTAGTFIGFSVASDNIGRVNIATAGFETFDNVRFTSNGVVAVPEPASVVLISLGLLGCVGYRRFKKA